MPRCLHRVCNEASEKTRECIEYKDSRVPETEQRDVRILTEKKQLLPISGERKRREKHYWPELDLYNQKLLKLKKGYASYCLTPSYALHQTRLKVLERSWSDTPSPRRRPRAAKSLCKDFTCTLERRRETGETHDLHLAGG